MLASGDDELELLGSDGHRRLRIDIGLRARPTRNELILAGTRAAARADLFHGYAVFEPGRTSRTAKATAPLRSGARLLWAAGTNLARRAVRREPAFPGLRELIRLFYASIAENTPPPIDLDEVVEAAALIERVGAAPAAGRETAAVSPDVYWVSSRPGTGPRAGASSRCCSASRSSCGSSASARTSGSTRRPPPSPTSGCRGGRPSRPDRSANQHLLYSLLGSLSFAAFGESEAAARLPAVVFGTLGVGALYLLGRLVAPERQAIAASALLAVSYHHVWFSAERAGYTGMIFFSTLGTVFFLRGLAHDRGPDWTAYAACMTLGVLSDIILGVRGHGPGGVVPAGPPRWSEWRSRHAPVTRRLAAALLGVGVFSLLGHALVLTQMIEFFRTVDRTGLGWTSIGSLAPIVGSGPPGRAGCPHRVLLMAV